MCTSAGTRVLGLVAARHVGCARRLKVLLVLAVPPLHYAEGRECAVAIGGVWRVGCRRVSDFFFAGRHSLVQGWYLTTRAPRALLAGGIRAVRYHTLTGLLLLRVSGAQLQCHHTEGVRRTGAMLFGEPFRPTLHRTPTDRRGQHHIQKQCQ
jgi:hypothetical protein